MIDYCPRKLVGLPVLAELGHGVFNLGYGNSLWRVLGRVPKLAIPEFGYNYIHKQCPLRKFPSFISGNKWQIKRQWPFLLLISRMKMS